MVGSRAGRPWWVRFGLWGLKTRASAQAFVWGCVALGAGCLAYSVVDPRFAFGGVMLLAAAWYWLSIRWVDRNGGWS
jgi:hypothetical protein